MYRSHSFRNVTEGYPAMLSEVLELGKPVAPRGMPTLEISSAVTLTRPLEMVPFVYGRHNNYFGMLMESMMPLSEVNDIPLFQHWNKGLIDYSDDGNTSYGAYGPRMAGQIEPTIQQLKDDPDGRRAAISILEARDAGYSGKDKPCNNEVMFKIREGHLNMTVINRSNDIHWGLFGVNSAQFAMLLNYMAGRVGVLVGEQTHISDSLHVYLDPHPNARLTDSIRKKVGINSVRTRVLDSFYDYYPVGDASFPIFNGSLEGQYKKLLESAAEYNPDFAEPFFDSTFLNIAFILLETYTAFRREVWKGLASPVDAAITRMYDRIQALVESKPGYVPLDWIFACTATLVWYNKPPLDTANKALEYWERLTTTLGYVWQRDIGRDLLKFLVEG